jgi:hypothetical protein
MLKIRAVINLINLKHVNFIETNEILPLEFG